MCKPCILCKIVFTLLVIGALNWGLVGAFDFNLVDQILGVDTAATRIIYSLVGLAGIAALVKCFFGCPSCKVDSIE